MFDLRQKNVPTPDPDPTHGFASVQQGEVRSRGLELEAKFRAAPGLDVITSYTYTDAQVQETDRPVFRQPRIQAQIWGDYRFGEDVLPGVGVGVGGGVRHVGSSYAYAAADGSAVNTGSYTLLDLQAHYDIGDWRLLATVSNVANKEYISTCQASYWCFYGYPRTVSISARYNW